MTPAVFQPTTGARCQEAATGTGCRCAGTLANSMNDIGAFLDDFQRYSNFGWSKINHGFWEALGDVEHELGWPISVEDRDRADVISRRADFFVGGFVDELVALLNAATEEDDPALTLAFELTAWPEDNRIIGTPFRPERSFPLLERFHTERTRSADGLLLKRAVADGTFERLFQQLAEHFVIVVGPSFLSPFFDVTGLSGVHVSIHPSAARKARQETEDRIVDLIGQAGPQPVVLFQSGTLAPYWMLRLRPRFPHVRWIDAGLALSIVAPEDILWRPWGKAHRRDIVRFYNQLVPTAQLPEQARLPLVDGLLQEVLQIEVDASPVPFVASEPPDHSRVRELLQASARVNHWANSGPLWRILGTAYQRYMSVPPDNAIVPCSNGGVALEALARLQSIKREQSVRWAVSSFTFRNQGRGYFANSEIVDCSDDGMLSLTAVRDRMAHRPIDGIVVTNIFGLWTDFDPYVDFVRETGMAMIIDNAAGVRPALATWPYQAFSLHHTKPYGFGEGGLAVVPAEDVDTFAELITYGSLDRTPAGAWVGNGKLSEAACAYHLDRLERAPEWTGFYEMQAIRIRMIAERAGLRPLFDWEKVHAATSLPFLATQAIPVESLGNPHLVLGKYYQPLAATSNARDIYARIVNIPAHPDVARIAEHDLLVTLGALAGNG